MTLRADSISWALDFLVKHGDGDLFPKILEIDAVSEQRDTLASMLAGAPLGKFQPRPSRRFIVPKDDISYRQATQLHPQDSLILSALMYQYGGGVEARRLNDDQVFSYRFSPTADDGLYASKSAWNDFWVAAYTGSQGCAAVLYCRKLPL